MRPVALAAATALLLVTAGCSSQNDAAPPAGSTPAPGTSTAAVTSDVTYPVTVDTPLGEVTLDKQPTRIVSLSPSATESLFAIGAGPQVVAADEYSTYPANAPKTDLSGFEPNVEAISGYKPDLVVMSNDTGGTAAALEKLGVPVLLSPAPTTLDQGYDELAVLGQATGHADETAQVVRTMRDDIATALAKAPNKPVRIYHELDSQYHSASSHSFLGSIYKEMGATNIADAADKDKTGYPQLTEEAVVKADPQLMVITDQVDYTADDVKKRPGWADVAAVKNGNVVTVDADIASRWGPRLPQLVEKIADAMTKASSSSTDSPAPATSSAAATAR